MGIKKINKKQKKTFKKLQKINTKKQKNIFEKFDTLQDAF